MKRTIEIEDTLDERKDSAIEDIKAELLRYCEENEPDTCPDWGDLDYSVSLHEIIDGAVPIYTHEINAAWFLYGRELEQAYEDAGIGNTPREKDGMVAIYCYIEQEAQTWFSEEAEDIFEKWQESSFLSKVAESLECTVDEARERLLEISFAASWEPANVEEAVEAINKANEEEESENTPE